MLKRDRATCPFACQEIIGENCTAFYHDKAMQRCFLGKIVSNSSQNFISDDIIQDKTVALREGKLERNVATGSSNHLDTYNYPSLRRSFVENKCAFRGFSF